MALALSHNIIQSFDLHRIVKPHIDEAFARFMVTIDSALVEENRLVLLYRKEAKDTLTFTLPLVSAHLHCSALEPSLTWRPFPRRPAPKRSTA
ncbi:MAG: hypothetical protein MZW92_03460 [Comamonadaceae bacterium]|nr:hypothetical protein [Comamonadaceae bacterium]